MFGSQSPTTVADDQLVAARTSPPLSTSRRLTPLADLSYVEFRVSILNGHRRLSALRFNT
jgi:hypothetical protein